MQDAFMHSTSSGCGISSQQSSQLRTSSAGGNFRNVSSDPTDTFSSKLVKGILHIICSYRRNLGISRQSDEYAKTEHLGTDPSSLINYDRRLTSELSTNWREVVRDSTKSDSSRTWPSLSLLYLPLRLLHQLYDTSTAVPSSGAQDDSIHPYYFNFEGNTLVQMSVVQASDNGSSGNLFPLSNQQVHVLTAPLVERSLLLLNILLQNRQGARTLSAQGPSGGYKNPFRQSVSLLQDPNDEIADENGINDGN